MSTAAALELVITLSVALRAQRPKSQWRHTRLQWKYDCEAVARALGVDVQVFLSRCGASEKEGKVR